MASRQQSQRTTREPPGRSFSTGFHPVPSQRGHDICLEADQWVWLEERAGIAPGIDFQIRDGGDRVE
jgi:hypothetical protein